MPAAAQFGDQALVVGHMVAVEHDDDDRAGLFGRRDDRAVDRPQSREQPRNADRKAGRRDRLAAKARDQPVIAPAAADRAEADRPSGLVFHFESQLGLEDRAGVIFEAADDGGVDAMTLCLAARRRADVGDLLKLIDAFGHSLAVSKMAAENLQRFVIRECVVRRVRLNRRVRFVCLTRRQARRAAHSIQATS